MRILAVHTVAAPPAGSRTLSLIFHLDPDALAVAGVHFALSDLADDDLLPEN